jgi:hypothetical protein
VFSGVFSGKHINFRRRTLLQQLTFMERSVIQKFAADDTLTKQATLKCIKMVEEVFFNLKGQGPLKLKKNIQRPNGKS